MTLRRDDLDLDLDVVVYRSRRRRQQESSEQNVTLIMIVVILTFIVCNVPAKVVQAVWRYEPQPCMSPEFFLTELSSVLEVCLSVWNVLEVFSSAVNFVVYCAFLRRFRRRLAAAFCCLEGGASLSRDDSQMRSTGASNLQPLTSTVRADGDAGRTVEIGVETTVQL